MKSAILLMLIMTISCAKAHAQDGKWQEERTTHFIIHYQGAAQDFIRSLSEKAEEYYNSIADNLGFMRFNFWLWDNRAHIYVYDDAAGYHLATGQPEWSAGAAMPGYKAIYTYANAQDFFATVLPHEMGHIIFREFVGFNNPAVPIWLEEGVASYQMEIRRGAADAFVKRSIADNTFMNIETLSGLNPLMMSDKEKVNLFYLESVSILDFLMKEHGRESFVLFCQNLRDKRNLNRAIASAYPYESTSQLNQAWQEHLKK
jgi:hypothetical protein